MQIFLRVFIVIFATLFIATTALQAQQVASPVPLFPKKDDTPPPWKTIEIGGRVLDERGQPVCGARVSLSYTSQAVRDAGRDAFFIFGDQNMRDVKTDEQGKWSGEVAQDFATAHITIWPPGNDHRKTDQKVPNIEKLKTKEFKTTIKDAYVIEGCVHDPEGNPLGGVLVRCNAVLTLPVGLLYEEKAYTDSQGCYRFQSSEPGEVYLGFFPKEYAPLSRAAEFGEKPQAIDVDLVTGKRVKIRIVDQKGDTLRRVRYMYRLDGKLFFFWPPEDDLVLSKAENGVRELIVPQSIPFELDCSVAASDAEKVEYMDSCHTAQELLSHSGNGPFEIVMYEKLRISGKVRDADTGELIKDYLIYGYEKIPASRSKTGEPEIRWNSEYTLKKEKDDQGVYRCVFEEAQRNYHLKVESHGYRPAISKAFLPSMGEVQFDFQLKKDDDTSPTEADDLGEPSERLKQWDADREIFDC